MAHNHNHSCEHEHDHIHPDDGEQNLLYSRVDRDRVEALNAVDPETGKNVIKPWDKRNDESEVCSTGCLVVSWLISTEAQA
jgi:hypothetical protein